MDKKFLVMSILCIRSIFCMRKTYKRYLISTFLGNGGLGMSMTYTFPPQVIEKTTSRTHAKFSGVNLLNDLICGRSCLYGFYTLFYLGNLV